MAAPVVIVVLYVLYGAAVVVLLGYCCWKTKLAQGTKVQLDPPDAVRFRVVDEGGQVGNGRGSTSPAALTGFELRDTDEDIVFQTKTKTKTRAIRDRLAKSIAPPPKSPLGVALMEPPGIDTIVE